MKCEDVLVCITNHNENENAIDLKNNFLKYFDTIIIDSDSSIEEDEFDVLLDNVYYSGLFNESVLQTKETGKKYLFFVASDVFFEDYAKIKDLIESLEDDIDLWAPSSRGQSHRHCKNHATNGVRDVPYLEGFCFLTSVENCEFIYPVSLDKNKLGWGLDLLLGFNCIKNMKKRCVVDDRTEIYHREGTGYSSHSAMIQMYDWFDTCFDDSVKEYSSLHKRYGAPGWKELMTYLRG